MNTIGRNDPCPCGSGKKYKKCHGAMIPRHPASDYDRIRRLDGETTDSILRYGKQQFGESIIEKAWNEYHFEKSVSIQFNTPEMDTFIWWLLYNYKPDGESPLAKMFLDKKGAQGDDRQRRLIESTINTPYSFMQVTGVIPAEELTMKDILRLREYKVQERSASTILKPGYIIFARVVEMDGIQFMMGSAPRVIDSGMFAGLLEMRKTLEKEVRGVDGRIPAEALLEYEEELRRTYFDIVEDMDNQTLEIRNTDGDPILYHTLKYEIASLEEAFHALKGLEQNVNKATDDELLARAETDENGHPVSIDITWLKKSKKDAMGGSTTMGILTIHESTMEVEVNSEKRSKRIQKEIQKRLGNDAVLLRIEIETQEQLMKKVDELPSEPKEETFHERLMRESPEAREYIKTMMEEHWKNWLDSPIPALRNMTPRKAAKHPEGRELLESLLLDFETHNLAHDDEYSKVDTAKLRRELGM